MENSKRNEKNDCKFSKFEELFKHNSTNTIVRTSSQSTPSNPNIVELTVRVSLVIDMHLRNTGLDMPSGQRDDPRYQVFNDSSYWKKEVETGIDNSVTGVSRKRSRESETTQQAKRVKSDYPSIETICTFIGTLGTALNFSPYVLILALTYVNRLLITTKFRIHVSNWRSCMLGAIICAHKMWEDRSLKNVSFSIICPSFQLGHINELEINFLSLLGFRMHISVLSLSLTIFISLSLKILITNI